MKRLTAWILVFAVTGSVYGADPAVPTRWPELFSIVSAPEAKIDAESARLVKELASPDFAVRDRASKELSAGGLVKFRTIREAANESKDPEVIGRVSSLLNITYHFPANLPAHTIRELVQYQRHRAGDRSAVDFSLGASELWGERGDLFFRVSIQQETNLEAIAALSDAMSSRRAVNARQLIASGHLGEAEVCLAGDLNNTTEDYVALRALRAGSTLDPDTELRALTGLRLPSRITDQLALYLNRAARSPRAVTYASRLAGAEWRVFFLEPEFPMLLEAGDYAAIADLARIKKDQDISDAYNVPEIRAQLLVGKPAEAATQLHSFLERVHADPRADGDWIWLLVQNERIEDCIGELKGHGDNTDAFLVLAWQMRLREAMKLPLKDAVGPAQVLESMGLHRQAVELLGKYPPVPESVTQDLQYAAEFQRLGQTGQAKAYEDKAWQLQDQYHERVGAFVALFDDYAKYQEAKFWAGGDFEDVGRERFETARQIVLQQRKPNISDDFVEQALSGFRDDGYQQYSVRYPISAILRSGNAELAKQLILMWCERTNDPTMLELLGDLALDNNRPVEAAEYYLKAATVNRTNASLMFRTGIALSRQAQTREEGEHMQSYAPLLALADLEQIRRLYDAMKRYKGAADADAWIFDYGGKFGRPDAFLNQRIAYARDRALSRGDYGEALQWQTRALFRPSELSRIRVVNGLANLALYHRLRSLDALARKDFVTLLDAMDRGLNLGPPDVDLLEKTLPTLRVTEGAVADKILMRAIERLEPVVEDYPESKYAGELARLRALMR